jgi:hypothetical protein
MTNKNAKFTWPKVVIKTKPEMQRFNLAVWSFDVLTDYHYDRAGLNAMADAAQNNAMPEHEEVFRTQILRENAPCRTASAI